MKRALPSLVFCALCVSAWSIVTSPPPLPTVKRPHKSAAVERGAGAKALIAPPPSAGVPVTTIIVWKYPASVNPSNLWWAIESSTDLRTWSVLVSNASGEATVNIKRSEPWKRLTAFSQC